MSLGLWGYSEARAWRAAETWTAHTRDVIEVLIEASGNTKAAAAALQASRPSGAAAQPGVRPGALEAVSDAVRRARDLTRDNPIQQRRVDTLETLLQGEIRGNAALTVPLGASEGEGKGLGRIESTLKDMLTTERQLLEERRGEASRRADAARRSIATGFPVGIVLLLVGLLRLTSEAERSARSETALLERESRWTATLMSIGHGVIVFDAGGVVEQMNRAAEQLTGSTGAGLPIEEVLRLVDAHTRQPLFLPPPGELPHGAAISLPEHSVLVLGQGVERPIAGTLASVIDERGGFRGAVVTFRDMTEARATDARFERLLEAAPDAILIVDGTGRITTANTQAEVLFGYSAAELGTMRIEALVPQRLRERHLQHRSAYTADPSPRPMGAGIALFALQKSGKELPVEISLSPAPDGLVIASVRDVSKRRDLERFRDEYIGYISHDLKNPLSVISLQARLLEQQLAARGLGEESRSVEVISRSASFIAGLVRELLEMAYVESDQIQIRPEAVFLPTFLKDVLERTVSSSDRPRLRLEIRDESVGLFEASHVERVVANLVQNAIKYSAQAAPIVIRLEAEGPVARVSVSDEGPGLEPDEAAYVFDKYRRARSARTKEGLGLGLYISRKIIEAHGGRIDVTSTPGKGSSFSFTLPLLPTGKREAHPISSAPTPGAGELDLRGKRLLLVDDEANAVAALKVLLSEEGLVVTAALSGEEALLAAQIERPDVVVVDVEMPGMTGVELLHLLRASQPALPAVIMSGFMSHHAGIAEVRNLTGAAYVGKPLNVDELVRTLRRLLAAPS